MLGLIDALEHAYKQLSRHPQSGSNRYAHELDLPGLRSLPLKRYPYVVFYMERTSHIEVLARTARDERYSVLAAG